MKKETQIIDFNNINTVIHNLCLQIAKLDAKLLAFISDKQKGKIPSLFEVMKEFPEAEKNYRIKTILYNLYDLATVQSASIPISIRQNSYKVVAFQEAAVKSIVQNSREILANNLQQEIKNLTLEEQHTYKENQAFFSIASNAVKEVSDIMKKRQEREKTFLEQNK